jgi:hypothetical protein
MHHPYSEVTVQFIIAMAAFSIMWTGFVWLRIGTGGVLL